MEHRAGLRAAALLLALLPAGACVEEERREPDLTVEDTSAAVRAAPAPQSPAVVNARFQPGADAAGQQVGGTVEVRRGAANGAEAGQAADDDGFTVTVHLTGLAPGEHAWHIHRASCAEDGPIVAPMTETVNDPGLEGPLEAEAGGMAMDTAFVPTSVLPLSALETTAHSLHVHARGGLDHGPTVACADLAAGTGGMAFGPGAYLR